MKLLGFKFFFENINTYKAYLILMASLAFGLIAGFSIFEQIKYSIIELSLNNQKIIMNDIRSNTHEWIEKRVYSLETSKKLIEKSNLSPYNQKDKEDMDIILNTLLATQDIFEEVYMVLIDKNLQKAQIYKNGNLKTLNKNTNLSSYMENIKENKTSIQKGDKQNNMTICAPIRLKNNKNNILCGSIKTQKLVQQIEKLNIDDAYFFITDESLRILTDFKDKDFRLGLQNTLNQVLRPKKEFSISTMGESIALSHIMGFDWYIGVGMDTQKIIDTNLSPLKSNGLFFLAIFVGIMIVINTCYEIINRRFKEENEEYEEMLTYRSKLMEMGENLGAMNHQLKQPINSLSLLISSTLFHLQNNILTDKILRKNLELCDTSITAASKTIDTFRRFYKYNETPKTLDLKNCIDEVAYILSIELSLKNIVIDTSNVKSIKLKSVETFIYQILLVLLQNAKDAIIEVEAKNRKIYVKSYRDSKYAYIEVQDYGVGIDEDIYNDLFERIATSKESSGTGFGLFFARKIAQNSLGGNIEVLNKGNPTIFKLSIRL